MNPVETRVPALIPKVPEAKASVAFSIIVFYLDRTGTEKLFNKYLFALKCKNV